MMSCCFSKTKLQTKNLFSKSRSLLFLLLGFVSMSASAAPGDITTIAGNGIPDGILATEAPMDVKGVHVDNTGNIYIAASVTHRVYKVDTNGLISTIAGNGISGYSGDGGLATNASLSNAEDITSDSQGNIYFTDTGNNRIRKVDVSGIITTIAGTLYPGYSGDGGPAIDASLNYPQGITVDSNDNIYFTDAYNHRLRKIDLNGIITTVAGNGIADFSGDGGLASNASINRPWDVFIDADENIYIVDQANNRVRMINSSGIITTIAGNGEFVGFPTGDGGPATSAILASPAGIAKDSIGNLFISSARNTNVRIIDTNGIISTLVNQQDGIAQISRITLDSTDNLYISDFGPGNSHVRKLDYVNPLSIVAGNGNHGFYGEAIPAYDSNLYGPTGMTVDNNGNLIFADRQNNKIRKIDSNGVITTIVGNGIGFSGDGGAAVDAGLYYPTDVAVDLNNNLYIADDLDHRIRKVDSNGIINTITGNGNNGFSGDGGFAIDAEISQPMGITTDLSGNIYFADFNNHRIRKIDVDGIITTVAGNGVGGFSGDGGLAVNASLNLPRDVAVDVDGNIYIADTSNNSIRKVDTSGIITSLSTISINWPSSITISQNGDLYIAESFGHRVSKVSKIGIFSVIQVVENLDFQAMGN